MGVYSKTTKSEYTHRKLIDINHYKTYLFSRMTLTTVISRIKLFHKTSILSETNLIFKTSIIFLMWLIADNCVMGQPITDSPDEPMIASPAVPSHDVSTHFIVEPYVEHKPYAPLFSARKHEVRAVWLTLLKGLDWPTTLATTSENIKCQQKELTDILNRLQEAHINTVILQTRLRGNLIYPSEYEEWSEYLTGVPCQSPGYDPLAFAIDECHKRGMEVHAWLVSIPLGGVDVHKEMGKKSITKRCPHLCKKFRNNWYLNPGHPESKHYLANLVGELVSRYDVDGVHLDYIRYPDRPKRFPDTAEYRKYGKGKDLAQWRRDNITEIVRAVYSKVKSIKPWVKVSSAPLGKYRGTKRYPNSGWNGYHDVYQEAQRWMKEGIQDMIFPMLYYRDNFFYPFLLDWKETSCGRMVVPGLGIYFLHSSEGDWKLSEIERQLNFIRWSGCEGEAHFRSRFLTENTGGLYQSICYNYYHTPALVPPMTWIDSIAPTTPTIVRFTEEEKRTVLEWTTATDNLSGGVCYNVYASDTYPVDIDNPANILIAKTADTSYIHNHPFRKSGTRFYAVTAIDRCGNESEKLEINKQSLEAKMDYEKRLKRLKFKTLLYPKITPNQLLYKCETPQL